MSAIIKLTTVMETVKIELVCCRCFTPYPPSFSEVIQHPVETKGVFKNTPINCPFAGKKFKNPLYIKLEELT